MPYNNAMKRTQIQLDDQTYRRLRDEAHARRTSIAAVVREALRKHLGLHHKRHSVADFTFIGSGRSDQGGLEPVSERHDEALTEAWS
uniref:Ribbon-helix-helix protein CopG domain-containing protein n=1 Tax=uncultured prokaryote TaxID=198431 RepID=H5S980_9ZZZZ|nr:hypothetical protein HGMM_F03A04C39 [uncultured prokaryote]